ncbi:MAG: biotin/lipoyl-binding protein [Acidobacteria bacterium]|nr:biotin/lipoyl-binding protein [Acidobacteriota bacterium]
MTFTVLINGLQHTLELVRNTGLANGLACRLDGVSFQAEAVEVQPGVYSLLLGGKSFQARVAPESMDSVPGAPAYGHCAVQIDGTSYLVAVRDPRRRSGNRTAVALEGKQNVAAPMPGKVVRILVAENQPVEAGQGLIVVEAMKMQNEIKCPRSGVVGKVQVREGQAVNAGETLLVVE